MMYKFCFGSIIFLWFDVYFCLFLAWQYVTVISVKKGKKKRGYKKIYNKWNHNIQCYLLTLAISDAKI